MVEKDIVMVGCGPSSLAVAIAIEESSKNKSPAGSLILERKDCVCWHPGMLFREAQSQVSFLKDLVTQRNPRSRYSFLNFLHEKGRLDAFVNLQTFNPFRSEISDYLAWVAASLERTTVKYNTTVSRIEPLLENGDIYGWRVSTIEGKEYRANRLIFGAGRDLNLHDIYHFDGVLTFAENSVIATAMIAQTLNLPGISPEAAIKSRNKLYMREAHRRAGASHPEFHLADTLEQALIAAEEIGYPVILKPTLGAASQFVYKIDSPEALQEVYPKARKGILSMSQFTNEGVTERLGPNTMLIESWLDGSEYLIEAFSWNGETVLGSVVDRVTLEGNNFDDDVHHAPTSLTALELAKVKEAVQAGARAQGLEKSVMHAEIRFHKGQPYIVEIAARPGGGGLDFMARISSGYCPIKTLMDVACDRRPEYLEYSPGGKDTFALCLISEAGTVTSVNIPKSIRDDPAVFMLKIIAAEGALIRRPPYGNDIIGFLGVSGNSRKETEEKALSYSQQIVVKTS